MARIARKSKQETIQFITNETIKLITEKGVNALAARNIAKRTGYSVGSLYTYFEDIDEIVLHIKADTLTKLHDTLSNIKLGNDPVKNTNKLMRAVFTFINENQTLWELITQYQNKQALPKWYLRKIENILEVIASALDKSIKKNSDTITILWAFLHGLWVLDKQHKLGYITHKKPLQLSRILVEKLFSV